MQQRTCTVPECQNPPRTAKADWCKKHYHRWYRHGDVNACATESGISVSKGRRYLIRDMPGHPLAKTSGKVYVHQAVLYAAIGPGAHACHWCTTTVRWELGVGEADRLVVDHLNGTGDDNRPENLVPSCNRCNSMRGGQARADALRAAGWWSSHDTVAKQGRAQRVA